MNRPAGFRKIAAGGLSPRLVAFSRTVHIYLTLLGLLIVFLFGVTGFTLNHEGWLAGPPRNTTANGRIPMELVSRNDRPGIVEYLRTTQRITGALVSYDNSDDELSLAFKQPGQVWDV